MKKVRLPLKMLGATILAAVILAALFVAPALAASTTKVGIDFAGHGELRPQKFLDEGVSFVARYIAGGNSSWKEINPAEADMWSNAGISIVLVWETTANRATKGYQAGYSDAPKAFAQAKAMGMPEGKPVYFAVDCDTSGPSVQSYFQGVYDWARTNFSDGMATSRIGVYGGHDPVKYIMRAGYAKYGWQTKAWMHGKGWLPNVIQQHTFEYNIDGVQTDLNRVDFHDFGQWVSTRVHPPKAAA